MRGFCEQCRDIVEYRVSTVETETKIKGKVIRYVGKVAHCDECKEEIFIPEIRDYNLNALDVAYRNEEDLISVETIEKILEKYDIGKRPLSLLLGWGEGTLTRYVDGNIPSKIYSDLLRQILEDEKFYREILEKNKENISPVAYKKSLDALDKINLVHDTAVSKLESAVKYLLMQTSEITPLALQKLLYFSQGFQKAFTGTFMFDENCEAWVHGPVYRNVYEKYREYGYNPIEGKGLAFCDINLTEDEKELLDHIVLYFGCYSGKILENMTHSEEPWRVTRKGLNDWVGSDRVIPKKEIDTYFSSVKEKYKMLNLMDIKDYSKDLFSKLYS